MLFCYLLNYVYLNLQVPPFPFDSHPCFGPEEHASVCCGFDCYLGLNCDISAVWVICSTWHPQNPQVTPTCSLPLAEWKQQLALRSEDRWVLLTVLKLPCRQRSAFTCKVSAGLKKFQVKRAWSIIINIIKWCLLLLSYLPRLPSLPTGHEAAESPRWLLVHLHFHLLGLSQDYSSFWEGQLSKTYRHCHCVLLFPSIFSVNAGGSLSVGWFCVFLLSLSSKHF